MDMIIECPVCGAEIKSKDNEHIWWRYDNFTNKYYVKAMCYKCAHLMLFKMEQNGEVIWSWDDTVETEIKVNLKGE